VAVSLLGRTGDFDSGGYWIRSLARCVPIMDCVFLYAGLKPVHVNRQRYELPGKLEEVWVPCGCVRLCNNLYPAR
jgi:hypothetical protein